MFIMDGIREVAGVRELLGHFNDSMGWIEIVQEIAEFGIYIEEKYEECWKISNDKNEGLPGVFDYEVTIEFGKWYAEQVCAGNGMPTKQQGQAQIDTLVKEFMK
jgi:hypothetical protein